MNLQTHEVHSERIGSLAFQTTHVNEQSITQPFIRKGFYFGYPNYFLTPTSGTINSTEGRIVTSAVGMSGGPIIGYMVDLKKKNITWDTPKLLGIQASEWKIEGKNEITKLTITGCRTLKSLLGS